ncbi:hypothetical protein LSTR_LSTR014142 [Laodelphax striatellus]|uniref:NWD1/2-like winged helix-turn-helix domain-containing protein n=1 Tax=Laodelphax striatellus TaxID=195883 RepID=A0A482WQZ1_LAOST|nr:hypothetical protein LSTR_LSTR014142 [Laodelphax striatellus]
MINEEVVEEVLRGHLEASKWAIPRVVKVFISSTRTDFQEERKILLEQVGPEIQDMFDNTGLEVELVDMHYGTGQDVHLDPFQFDDHLHEIKRCHKVSRGCFYLCLIGEKTTPSPLPASLPANQVTTLKERLGDEIDTLYPPDENGSDAVRSLRRPGDISDEDWHKRMTTLIDQLKELGEECPPQLRRSAVEHQFQVAAELNPECMLGVIRAWEGTQTEPENLKSGQRIWQCLEDTLPGDNVVKLTVPWKGGGVDPDFNEHDEYISSFQETITDKLKMLINKSIEENPEINARNKPNQEVFKEALVHLALCQKHVNTTLKEVDWSGSPTLDHIKHLMTSATTRHGPILVQGGHGSGKTALINTIYVRCEEWFGKKALRIIRFAGMTPRSSYNLELLRIICSQLTLLLQPSAPCIPRDASFDPLYVNNWFQTLVRRFDIDAPDGAGHLVIILIDDLHRLNPLDSDIVAALSWLPISLPSNIHIVATTSVPPDVLKLTPVQREKFRAAECYLELPPASEKSLESKVEKALDELAEDIGSTAMARLSSQLTIAEFGLSETELLELLMPTSGDVLELSDGFFNFSTLCSVLRKMMNRDLLREKFMSGRVLLCWKHELTSKAARKRYLLQQDTTRALHAEIANLFFSEIATQQQTQQEGTVQSHEEGKQTPFQSSLQANDVTYSLRHVEESWIHLLKSGDSSRLKQLTMCNFDFLLAAVRTVSVSYLRSILEHVRCYLLDRELELVYYTVRKSSDVLTRDTLQFGAQLICWLRSVADSSGELMARLMLSAMAWCDGYTDPLLVPLTGWLHPPLPLQIKNVVVNGGVNLIEPTPSAQHIVVVPHTGDPQLWHVMSNTLVTTFKGHSGRVLCIAMTKQSQYLLTGGEDTSIIIWDLKTFELKLRIYEHMKHQFCA